MAKRRVKKAMKRGVLKPNFRTKPRPEEGSEEWAGCGIAAGAMGNSLAYFLEMDEGAINPDATLNMPVLRKHLKRMRHEGRGNEAILLEGMIRVYGSLFDHLVRYDAKDREDFGSAYNEIVQNRLPDIDRVVSLPLLVLYLAEIWREKYAGAIAANSLALTITHSIDAAMALEREDGGVGTEGIRATYWQADNAARAFEGRAVLDFEVRDARMSRIFRREAVGTEAAEG